MFDSWLEMGGNKYFGTSSTLKDNINFQLYTKTVQPSYPSLRVLWHKFMKILHALIQAINASQIARCFLKE